MQTIGTVGSWVGGLAVTSLVVAACVGEGDTLYDPQPAPIVQSSEVSACGGFMDIANGGSGEQDYCAAEVLSWSYDAAAKELLLIDSRVDMNCCGEREAVMAMEGGVHVVTQTEVNGDCLCFCVYDFHLVASGIDDGPFVLRVDRQALNDVKSTGPTTVFEGNLDLSAGSGQVIVDDTPIDNCDTVP